MLDFGRKFEKHACCRAPRKGLQETLTDGVHLYDSSLSRKRTDIVVNASQDGTLQ